MHLIRRTFLGGLFAAFAAPAIVRATSLMPINPLLVPEHELFIPRTRVLGPPRCGLCSGPWGMCGHTGGPLNLIGEVPGMDKLCAELTAPLPPMYSRRYMVEDWHMFNKTKDL